MRSDQNRKFDMLRRVQQFMDDFTATLLGINANGARKELDQIVHEMGINEATQATSKLSAQSHTATQGVLRRNLWKHHMLPVATIAAAHFREAPGLEALRLPRSKVKVAVLVQAATAMADAARPHREVFVKSGLPENFADALLAAAMALRGSVDARLQEITKSAVARDGLKAAVKRSEVVVRMLDAQVKSALIDDPKALAGWKSAKRVGKGKGRSVETTAAASTPPDVKTA